MSAPLDQRRHSQEPAEGGREPEPAGNPAPERPDAENRHTTTPAEGPDD